MSRFSPRPRMPFRTVNRRGDPGYDPGLQRHHLLPRQLLSRDCFGLMFDTISRDLIGFDDFRQNGLLLPASEEATLLTGLPLHRGPHRRYNVMVMECVGEIEKYWPENCRRSPLAAIEHATMRLALLRRALRRRLLSPIGTRFSLNRRDPFCRSVDFIDLDAMADALWGDTAPDSITGGPALKP